MTLRFEPVPLPKGPRAKRTDAGFTLIEVLVTLTVLGLALTLIAGYKPPWASGRGLRGTARELASALRVARAEAISVNRPVAVVLDLAGHHFQVGTALPRPLPAHLTIGLLTVEGERHSATVGDIRFNPDGSSTGGRISIADHTQKISIGVDWLSGRVSIADGR
jgi:general secretion pathway protein H